MTTHDTCPECNGRGHLLFAFSTPTCTHCGGTGKAEPEHFLMGPIGAWDTPIDPHQSMRLRQLCAQCRQVVTCKPDVERAYDVMFAIPGGGLVLWEPELKDGPPDGIGRPIWFVGEVIDDDVWCSRFWTHQSVAREWLRSLFLSQIGIYLGETP